MLKENTILITGGSSGIGLKLSQLLIEEGNTVLICGRSKEKLEAAKAMLPEIEIYPCDISSEKECRELFHAVSINHPQCNILINNAAIAHATDFLGDDSAIVKAEAEFQSNILGPIRLSKLFLPLLLKNPNAQLINITTGLVYAPRAIYPFYNATKAALHAFTQVLRMQLRDSPLKVVEVLMPAVDTPWHKGAPPDIAIPVDKAVGEMLRKMEKGVLEVKVGGVGILYWLSRIAPGFAIRKINNLR